jgi:hypothetical protein
VAPDLAPAHPLRQDADRPLRVARAEATRALAQPLRTYGALVADNAGSPRVYIPGATDRGWNDEALNGIKSIPASALEAVVTNPVVRG